MEVAMNVFALDIDTIVFYAVTTVCTVVMLAL